MRTTLASVVASRALLSLTSLCQESCGAKAVLQAAMLPPIIGVAVRAAPVERIARLEPLQRVTVTSRYIPSHSVTFRYIPLHSVTRLEPLQRVTRNRRARDRRVTAEIGACNGP